MIYNVMDMIRQFHMSVKDRGSSTRVRCPKFGLISFLGTVAEDQIWIFKIFKISHVELCIELAKEDFANTIHICWPIQDSSGGILPRLMLCFLSFSLQACCNIFCENISFFWFGTAK